MPRPMASRKRPVRCKQRRPPTFTSAPMLFQRVQACSMLRRDSEQAGRDSGERYPRPVEMSAHRVNESAQAGEPPPLFTAAEATPTDTPSTAAACREMPPAHAPTRGASNQNRCRQESGALCGVQRTPRHQRSEQENTNVTRGVVVVAATRSRSGTFRGRRSNAT